MGYEESDGNLIWNIKVYIYGVIISTNKIWIFKQIPLSKWKVENHPMNKLNIGSCRIQQLYPYPRPQDTDNELEAKYSQPFYYSKMSKFR